MSIRTRIAASIFLSAVVLVSFFTALYYQEASSSLEAGYTLRATAMAESFQTELRQKSEILGTELEAILGTSGKLPFALTGANTGAQYRWALENGRNARLDILKVVRGDGTVVSSRHWPISFGVEDRAIQNYRGARSGESLIMEPVQGEAEPVLSLQMWRQIQTGDHGTFYLVVGHFLGKKTLERSLERKDGDVLAICVARLNDCWTATKLPEQRDQFTKRLGKLLSDDIHFESNALFEGKPHKATLSAGVKNENLLDRKTWERILWVALSALILSLVLGFLLGHHIGMPLLLLSNASLRLADGELDARVETPPRAVTEVGQLVDSFNLMASELEQNRERLLHAERVATWQEIAKGLAHELKNPLTPILGALKVVRRARDKDHPDFDLILQEQSYAVEEEVMRLKNMADSFARFARLPEPQPEPMCLLEMLDTVLSLYAGADAVEVVKDFPDEAPMVADAERLRTLFANLVKNACDAMGGTGRICVTVKVHFEASVSGYEVRVEDTGPGIAAQVSDKLFMPYVTTKADGGTGLGLALGLRIVTEMGGRIGVDSEYQEGASFVIWLPAASRHV